MHSSLSGAQGSAKELAPPIRARCALLCRRRLPSAPRDSRAGDGSHLGRCAMAQAAEHLAFTPRSRA